MRTLFFLTTLLVLAAVLRYPENPPPAHTGGFGEKTCLECHFDGDLNPPGGRLMLREIGEGIILGNTHRLEILLDKDDMERAGFQLSVRYADGRQAGSLWALDDHVAVDTLAGVQYARHTLAGTELKESGSTTWLVEWHAPDDTSSVIFHVAANAANGDDSAFGDAIYHIERSAGAWNIP